MLAAAAVALTVSPAAAQRRALLGQRSDHIAAAAHSALLVDKLAPSTPLRLNLALPLRNRPQLDQLLRDLYDPSSSKYHHFLTSAQFTAQFGPSQADYNSLIDYAKSRGMTVTETFSNRAVLSVSAPVFAVENTFHVAEFVYQRPGGGEFYGPDREPSIGDDCPVDLLCVGGLDNHNPPHRMNSTVFTPRDATGQLGQFSPIDFRKAYDVPPSLTGTGIVLGVFQNTGYLTTDITSFEDGYGLRRVPLENVYIGSKTPANQGNSGETALDLEMQVGIAPGATKMVCYIGDNGLATANKIAADNVANVVSSSLGYDDGTDQAEGQAYQQMAAQGQSYFVASGDGGAWNGGSQNPQDQQYVTSVGGSHLITNPDGMWNSEPTWGGSGGGISPLWSLPWYQQGLNVAAIGGSTTMRNGPDVSMPADNVSFFFNGSWGGIGGTSCAAPLWAGITAVMDQQRAANGLGKLGLLNPAIYAIGAGANYTNDFHDITAGNNANNVLGYNAVPGYDLATGWGTPIVANLVTDLAGGTSPNFKLTASSATVPQGGTGSSVITITGMNSFAGAVSLAVSTPPAGVTASLNSSSATTTATLTLGASSTAVPGVSYVKVTGTSGGIMHVVYVKVIVNATAGAYKMLSLSSLFNVYGIYNTGTTYATDGIGQGYAYSSNLLGTTVTWAGSMFTFGPANTLNVVRNKTIPLPAGSYWKIDLLGAAVYGDQPAQDFTVTYTDNTTTTFSQGVSDWVYGSSFPGESLVIGPMAYRTYADGSTDGARVNVYGYSFPLNTAKSVKSITLPPNDNVFVFAVDLVKQPTAASFILSASPTALSVARGTNGKSTISIVSTTGFGGKVNLVASGLPSSVNASFSPITTTGTSILTLTAGSAAALSTTNITITGTSGTVSHTAVVALTVKPAPVPVSLTSVYNTPAFYTNGTAFSSSGGIGGGYAYSANLLGPSIIWNNVPFTLGAANANNAVSAAGQVITLPQGKFATLRMLGTAINGSQPAQSIKVTYTDNTTAVISQGFSDWYSPQGYAGETSAMRQAYRNVWNGTPDNSTSSLFGYMLPLTNTKVVKSITLPINANVKILSMTLVP